MSTNTNTLPEKMSSGEKKNIKRFDLGNVKSDGIWNRDFSTSTSHLQAWLPSVHDTSNIYVTKIRKYFGVPKEDTIDSKHKFSIPRSFVKWGGMEHEVTSFKLDEEKKEIEIYWSPTPKTVVVELDNLIDLAQSSVSSNPTPELNNAAFQSAPPMAPTGIQVVNPPNPRGRFFYWEEKTPAPTREELAQRVAHLEERIKELDELKDMIFNLQEEIKKLRENK